MDLTFYQYSFQEYGRGWNAACGYLIRGNSHSRQVPRPEWAISVYEVVENNERVVRFEAAAFRVVSRDRQAPVETRPPITALTFRLKGQDAPLDTDVTGQPSGPSGEISGKLDPAGAKKLLKALSGGKRVEVSLAYKDGATDELEITSWLQGAPIILSNGPGDYIEGSFEDPLPGCVKSLRPGPPGAGYSVYESDLGWTPSGVFCFGPHGEPGRCGAAPEN